jgi:alpha-beta hydrolase superfamily lysophospholipase
MIKRKIVFSASVSACLFFYGCGSIAHKNYSQSFGRVEGFSDDKYTPYITWKEMDSIKYSREEVRFNSRENILQGFIYGGANSNGLVVISQGLGGTADSYFPMIMYFVDNGWRVFAFNNTGVDGSEGEDTRGLYQSVIDLDAALVFVEQTNSLNRLPIMLVGHSWGGYAVCSVLNYEHPVNAVVSFAGYNSGREVFEELGKSSAGIKFAFIRPQFRKIEKQRFGDVAKLTAIEGVNKTGIPVIIVHSSDDDVITAQKTSIYAHREKINNPHVEIIYMEGDDATGHERVFGSKRRKEYANRVNANWKEYYEADPENATLLQWSKEFNLDKTLANELDADLMEHINEFFLKAK